MIPKGWIVITNLKTGKPVIAYSFGNVLKGYFSVNTFLIAAKIVKMLKTYDAIPEKE
jgi:hypothetical protein